MKTCFIIGVTRIVHWPRVLEACVVPPPSFDLGPQDVCTLLSQILHWPGVEGARVVPPPSFDLGPRDVCALLSQLLHWPGVVGACVVLPPSFNLSPRAVCALLSQLLHWPGVVGACVVTPPSFDLEPRAVCALLSLLASITACLARNTSSSSIFSFIIVCNIMLNFIIHEVSIKYCKPLLLAIVLFSRYLQEQSFREYKTPPIGLEHAFAHKIRYETCLTRI